MGFASAICYRNELGKILSKLRVEYSETLKMQADRLGYSSNYLSMVSTDRRPLSAEFYKSIMEHYGKQAEEYKTELLNILFDDGIKARFQELVPGGTLEQLLYLIHGVK